MDYSNGLFTVCILAFSTTVCILGLILGVVFIFLQRQRDEQLLDDIYNTVCAANEASYDAENCNCLNGEFGRVTCKGTYKSRRNFIEKGLVGRVQERNFAYSKMRPRNYQMPPGAYNSENIPSNNSTMSNTEAELQQDELIPWGMIVFYILFSLFFLLTILRWTDLQLRIFCDFINSGRWRAYLGMEVPGRHDQGNFKEVALGDDPLLVKQVVKKVRFYDDTTIIEDVERLEAKSNGIDCANEDETKRE
ncbi:uncharacterized protein FTJAE_4040 [Fusarium tjaetaba]|uniref:Uncharacterized protein n=1 Tax=Fusarium tjaetaba TaxID=1567544 RepID=A0A8H5RXK2_9HYPO|nr:uncharacterized protein FTJAE_4040 [Fusarium tjaetaba]KAF5641563.1 hypothetical protein FTJAE_4040 [Fusarium tjaetaba]